MKRFLNIPSVRIGFGSIYFTLYAIFGIFSLMWLMTITSHSFGADYSIYLRAYMNARSGIDPYIPYSIGSGFVNHPFALIFVRFLFYGGSLDPVLIWTGASITAWIGCLILCGLLLESFSGEGSKPRFIVSNDAYLLLLFMFYGPFLETIAIGQINTFALVFILFALYLSQKDKDWQAGFFLGLAITLKTSPLLFLGYFFLVRKNKVIFSSLISTIVLSVVPLLLFSKGIISQFFSILPNLSNEIHPSQYNESLISVLYKLLSDTSINNLEALLPVLNKVVLLLLILTLWWFTWRFHPITNTQRIWLFCCFQILMVFSSPLVWYHHYVFLVFPIALLLINTSSILRVLGIIGLTLIQIERYFEHYFVRFPWPVFFATILLLSIAYVIFVRNQRNTGFTSIFLPTNSVERTGDAARSEIV